MFFRHICTSFRNFSHSSDNLNSKVNVSLLHAIVFIKCIQFQRMETYKALEILHENYQKTTLFYIGLHQCQWRNVMCGFVVVENLGTLFKLKQHIKYFIHEPGWITVSVLTLGFIVISIFFVHALVTSISYSNWQLTSI